MPARPHVGDQPRGFRLGFGIAGSLEAQPLVLASAHIDLDLRTPLGVMAGLFELGNLLLELGPAAALHSEARTRHKQLGSELLEPGEGPLGRQPFDLGLLQERPRTLDPVERERPRREDDAQAPGLELASADRTV